MTTQAEQMVVLMAEELAGMAEITEVEAEMKVVEPHYPVKDRNVRLRVISKGNAKDRERLRVVIVT
jgi:hypothetical protein